MGRITWLLNYCATYPNAVQRIRRSGMILAIESDASYLNESKARSTAAGYHFLSELPPTPDAEVRLNAPIHVLVNVLKEVCSSAAEAELAATFHNGKEGTVFRQTLHELGHPQPPTILYTDNSTAAGIANDSVKQRRSKAMDMGYFWIRDRVRQDQFKVVWRPGATNRGDYFTKHHPARHHRDMRSQYLQYPQSDAVLHATEAANCLQADDIIVDFPCVDDFM